MTAMPNVFVAPPKPPRDVLRSIPSFSRQNSANVSASYFDNPVGEKEENPSPSSSTSRLSQRSNSDPDPIKISTGEYFSPLQH